MKEILKHFSLKILINTLYLKKALGWALYIVNRYNQKRLIRYITAEIWDIVPEVLIYFRMLQNSFVGERLIE